MRITTIITLMIISIKSIPVIRIAVAIMLAIIILVRILVFNSNSTDNNKTHSRDHNGNYTNNNNRNSKHSQTTVKILLIMIHTCALLPSFLRHWYMRSCRISIITRRMKERLCFSLSNALREDLFRLSGFCWQCP